MLPCGRRLPCCIGTVAHELLPTSDQTVEMTGETANDRPGPAGVLEKRVLSQPDLLDEGQTERRHVRTTLFEGPPDLINLYLSELFAGFIQAHVDL